MIPTGNLTTSSTKRRTCEEVNGQSRWKKQRLSENEIQLWMTAPQPSKLIQVSKERMKKMKETMDKNLYTILSAPPCSGKMTFMYKFEDYLVLEGEQVVTLDMSWEGKWKSSEEDIFINYFNHYCLHLSWHDVLQSKRACYILLNDVEVLFESADGFWSILNRLHEDGNENIRILMFAENVDAQIVPPIVKLCGEQWLRLSREETRNFLENQLRHSEALTDNQLDIVHKFTAGHPKVLKALTTSEFKKYKTHNDFVRCMVSLSVKSNLQHLLLLQNGKDYGEEECNFLKKMLLEMGPDGLYSLATTTPEILKVVASFRDRGTITECQDGVQFSAPIFRMAIAHSIFKFPGLITELTSCVYIDDFDDLVLKGIRQLRPEQLRRYFEVETEMARRELLVDLYAIFSTKGDELYAVTPFIGSTFGAVGYSHDIHISGLANWAIDIVPNDPTKTPPHIRGFINEGVKTSPIEKWALLHLTHHNAAHVSLEIEENHWYLCCTPDCTSAKLIRKGLKDVELSFTGTSDKYHGHERCMLQTCIS